MIEQIKIKEIQAAIKKCIDENTSFTCYELPPKNKRGTFCMLELTGVTPNNSKTSQGVKLEFFISVFTEGLSSLKTYDAAEELSRALTSEIEVDKCNYQILKVGGGELIYNTVDREFKERRQTYKYVFEVFSNNNIF